MNLQIFSAFSSIFKSFVSNMEIKLVGGAFITAYSFLFSCEQYKLMIAIIILVIFDFLSGIAVAKKSGHEIKSSKACKSALKLGVYGILVSSAHLTDFIVGIENFGLNIEVSMMSFLALTELISILENSGRLGFAIPQKMLNQLTELRGQECNDGGC